MNTVQHEKCCDTCVSSSEPTYEVYGSFALIGLLRCNIRQQTPEDKARLFSPVAPACQYFQPKGV